jgi:UDP-N-acetylglucosamine acyltransferase
VKIGIRPAKQLSTFLRVNIHPTAVIHPQARLGAGVTVGPFAVIEQDAVLGDGCMVHPHAVICSGVVMGNQNTIGHGAILGGDPQDFAFKPEVRSRVRIGNGNRIREYATIHRGTTEGSETVIGNDCFLMGGAHLAHNVRLGDGVIIANNALLGGYVQAGDRVFIGGGCVFHQHIRIGRLAICQGASAFSKDIPPFIIAAERNGVAGLNVVGLRRAGFGAGDRAEIKRAFDLLYRSGKNASQAIEAAKTAQWGDPGRAFWDFVTAAKKKGLCDWLGSRRGAVAEEE